VSSSAEKDAELVRTAVLKNLKVHVRIGDQGNAPDDAMRRELIEALPDLSAFADNTFCGVRIILDWDHQIPSTFGLLRIMACYDDKTLERVDAVIADRDEEIGETNLYPEFDLPDYAEIEASENYVALLRPGSTKIEDFRFMSNWRKQVSAKVADAAVDTVRRADAYKKVVKNRSTEGLGGPVVIGWAPPCLANAPQWAIEVWVLTEFDGQSGKARVFMVDIEEPAITREFETDVQLA
jgi:hypothetical protein